MVYAHYSTMSIWDRSSYISMFSVINTHYIFIFMYDMLQFLRCTKTRRSSARHVLTRHCHHTTSESRSLRHTIIRHQQGYIRCTRESIVGRSSSYACLLFVVTYVHAYLYVITVDYRRLPLLPWLPYRIRLLILGNKTFTQSTLPLLPGNYQVITQITRSGMGRG